MSNKSPLPSMWAVPQVFRDRFGDRVGKQRLMVADGHLLLVLHDPPQPEQMGREGRFFWRAADGAWSSNGLGSGVHALKKQLDNYTQALAALEDAEERAELADDYFDILQDLTPLARAARNMHDVLQEAREAEADDRNLIVCRDAAYAIQRTADLLQADTKNGLECDIARRAEEEAKSSREMARAAHRLNTLAALFFPIVTFASIFGMNLQSGLEQAYGPWLFWAAAAAGIVGGIVLKALFIDGPAGTRK